MRPRLVGLVVVFFLEDAGMRGAAIERSCAARPDWIRRARSQEGVERLAARFAGRGYDRHRHDTYTVCLTQRGVQCFDYRGAARSSRAGDVVILHPDEPHDGRAGDERGFAYLAVYVAPARLAEALQAIAGRFVPLPFARDPVLQDPFIADAVRAAFADEGEALALDHVVLAIAEGLRRLDRASMGRGQGRSVDRDAVERVRAYLDAWSSRTVSASQLEAVAGLSRWELARQFRVAYGTSPHRYQTMRRLELARAALEHGEPIARAAVVAGFADQAHLTRRFREAHGLTPGKYRVLLRSGVAATPGHADRD